MPKKYRNLYSDRKSFGTNSDGTIKSRMQWLREREAAKSPAQREAEYLEILQILSALSTSLQEMRHARQTAKK